MKTWKPDTCECYVEEIYNGREIIGMGQVLRKCVAHAAVPDNQLYAVLHTNPDGENKRKNGVWKELLTRFEGPLSEVKVNEDGSTYLDFKTTVSVTWAYSGLGAARVLTVTVSGAKLTNSQKNSAQTSFDSTYGIGKVVLVN